MRRLLLLSGLAVTLVSPATAAARADLAVTGGSVRVVAGEARGAAVVVNRGGDRAGRSVATLAARVGVRYTPVARVRVPALRPHDRRRVRFVTRLRGRVPAGTRAVRVCVAVVRRGKSRRLEANNCRVVGRPAFPGATTTVPPGEASSPARPIAVAPGAPEAVAGVGVARYWVAVSSAYDGRTPFALLVWLHGCGGESAGDIETVAPNDGQGWIAVAPGGREGQCWDPASDGDGVRAAIADAQTHFAIDPRRVILGGYSSGGDLAYRLMFTHAVEFAGLLAENTSPFRDTGLSQSDALAGAAWKFNTVHLAHTGDDTYPIAGVRRETNAMRDAGFPITRVERPGGHYDDSTATTGTDHDLQTILLPHIDADGWLAPAR